MQIRSNRIFPNPMKNTLNCGGRLLMLDTPVVMGILNITPDSFVDGGKYTTEDRIIVRIENMLESGATIIDIGAESTRPFSQRLSAEDELMRLENIIPKLTSRYRECFFSIDTYKSQVAEFALQNGIHIVNDISGFGEDPDILDVVKRYSSPYILMHIKGKPENMQQNPSYDNLLDEVYVYFVSKLNELFQNEIWDVIVDPGFGFGKTYEHNLELISNLDYYNILGLPILIGISGKKFVQKLACSNAPTELTVREMECALHLDALKQGAKILRVHDVSSAKKTINLFQELGIHRRATNE